MFLKIPGEPGRILKELIETVSAHKARDRVFFMNISNQKELAALYRVAVSKEGLFAMVFTNHLGLRRLRLWPADYRQLQPKMVVPLNS